MSGRTVESRILRIGPKLLRRATDRSIAFGAEDKEKFEHWKKLPFLVEGEGRIRVDPKDGTVWISSWRPEEEIEGEIDQTTVFAQRGKSPHTRANIRLSVSPDIHIAIRFARNVLDPSQKGGEEVEHTQQVIAHIRGLLSQVRSGELTRENSQEAIESTQGVLASAGFLGAQKSSKTRLAVQVMQASHGLDSMGRLNPLIARTRLASAWVKATTELLFAKRVREKYSRVLILLEREDAVERFYLEQARDFMGEILNMSKTSSEFDRALRVLREFSDNMLSPWIMLVNPYRKPALYVKASLFGVPPSLRERLYPALLGEEVVGKLLEQDSIPDILQKHDDPVLARELVRERLRECEGVLDTALLPPKE